MLERLSQSRCISWSSSESCCWYSPKKLPELSKGIGEGIRGFKTAIHDDKQAPTAGAADIDLEYRNVGDDLRIAYPHLSFVTRE
jgi:hypothetical protein